MKKRRFGTSLKSQFPEIAKHLLVLVSTSFFFVGTSFCLIGSGFFLVCTLAFKVNGDVYFLLPCHVANPRVAVRLVPQI